MNPERVTSADYVVYVKHNSSAAPTGLPSGSADPASLGSVMRNNVVLFETSAKVASTETLPDGGTPLIAPAMVPIESSEG